MRIHRQRLALVAAVLVLAGLSLTLRISCAVEAGEVAVDVLGCNGDLGQMWFHRGLAAGRVPYLQPFLDPVSGQLALSQALVDRFRKAGLTDVSYTVYPVARHEIFNETNRDEVVNDLIGWLHRIVPKDS